MDILDDMGVSNFFNFFKVNYSFNRKNEIGLRNRNSKYCYLNNIIINQV